MDRRNSGADGREPLEGALHEQSVRHLLSDPGLLAHLSDIVAIYDRQMRFVYVSRTVEPHDPLLVLGTCVLDHIPASEHGRFRRAFDESWTTGRAQVIEARDLEGRWWQTRLVRVCGDDGVFHMLGTVVDIDERKQAEQALAERESRLRSAIEASGVGTWTWKIGGDEVVWDQGLCRIFGIESTTSPRDYATYLQHVHPDDRILVEAQIGRSLRTGVYDDFEHRIIRADGGVRHLFCRGSVVFGADGKVASLRGGVLDITERKRLEDQLRQVQKMDAVGQLTAGIAHNFNNLLSIVLPNVDLCRARAPREIQGHLDDIEQAAERAADMVRQLMRFARHEVGASKVPTDLVAVARRTESICRTTFDRRIQIELVAEPDLPAVLALAGDIEQVLLNICLNARDALEEGAVAEPRITIELERCAPQTVCVRVTDNGPGIDEEHRTRLFEPFFTTKPPGKGTGLGLASAYAIVSEHRGTITCTTGKGRGTTLSVELPVADERASCVPAPSGPLEAGGQETILVVDDEPLVRRVLRGVLERVRYRVLEAADGAEALAILADTGVDLVMLDRSMPHLSGEQVLARMRELGNELPVIVLTGEMGRAVDLSHANAC